MVLVGKTYWTVNLPAMLPRSLREQGRQRLRDAGLYAQTRERHTEAQARALAARIKAEVGLTMEVNRTADLIL